MIKLFGEAFTGNDGFTAGKSFISFDKTNPRTAAHEQVHIQQYKRLGSGQYWLRLGWEQAITNGGNYERYAEAIEFQSHLLSIRFRRLNTSWWWW